MNNLKPLCDWCHQIEVEVEGNECKECSRLPGHSHAGEDWRNDRIAALETENRALLQVIAGIRKELLCIPDNPDPVYDDFYENFMTEPHKVLLLTKATMKMVKGMKRIIEESEAGIS